MNLIRRIQKYDMEKFMIIVVMALMYGFGFLMFLGRILGIQILRYSAGTVIGLTVGLSGLFLAIFLLGQEKR